MHDGRLVTLEDVVRFYNEAGGASQSAGLQPLGLTGKQIGQLVAFLESLSSDLPMVTTPSLPDYAVLTLGDGQKPATERPAAAAPAGNPAAGEGSSNDAAAAITKAGCGACHTIPGIPGAVGSLGPNLSNIGVAAAGRIKGYTAEQYIHQSIVDPNAFIAPNCPTGACLPNVMPQNFGDRLNVDEIDTIVRYLLTPEAGGKP